MCCAGIYLWWERLSGKTNEIFLNAPLIHSIGAVFISFFTISFVLSPIIFPVYVYTSKKATKWFYISTIAALLVGLIAWRLFGLFMGTNIEQSGMVVSHLLGLRPNLFPGPIWTVFTIINLFSGAALAGISGNYLSKLQIKNISNVHMNVVSIFLVFMTLELCFLRILGVGEYDRYFWPVAFSIGLLLLSHFEKMLYLQKTVISNYFLISSLSIFYVISTIYTINSDVYSVATWKSGWQLVARGLIPSQIDAGYTWDGQFARSNMKVNPLSYVGLNQWWLDLWKNYVSCGVVTNSELHTKQFELVAVHDYELVGVGATKHLYLYQNVNAACTPLK
jgi:hypothetical protein